jgi:hypothetical protein
MKKELSELSNEIRKKKLKKGIRKCRYDTYFEQIIKDNMEQMKENKLNYVIGNYYNDSFQMLEKCNISNKEINILIDFKTFIRLPYSKENKDFILDIESKHKKNLKELSKLVVKKIILLVDFVFILNINEIMSIYFKDKEMIIEPISEESYTLFLLTLKNKPNFKVLDMINEKMGNSKVSTPINNQPPTFTQLIQNFIDNEKLENHQELKDEKEKLNQKIKKMRSVKDKTNNLFKIQNLDYDTS